ncbi:uncharacterized protein LOC134274213 isoform X2 [Saccostrea cucullata]|uniref:uncharacterized protein LOC134274213 isoform X2 n=1 Tax=Saccostrea cuccullata TaxID=36930 RepID=UPI002ED26187
MDPTALIIVIAVLVHGILLLIAFLVCCSHGRTQTRNSILSDGQRARTPNSNRINLSTIPDVTLHLNQASCSQSNVRMSPLMLDGYHVHVPRQTETHYKKQTSSNPPRNIPSPTENVDLNNREETRDAPESPPSPRNREQEERHIVPADLTESFNFSEGGFEDCPDVPPPSYKSLFQ